MHWDQKQRPIKTIIDIPNLLEQSKFSFDIVSLMFLPGGYFELTKTSKQGIGSKNQTNYSITKLSFSASHKQLGEAIEKLQRQK